MKTRSVLALILIGTALLTVGGLFKLLHWPTANIQLLLASCVQVFALFALAAKLLRGGALKELMDR